MIDLSIDSFAYRDASLVSRWRFSREMRPLRFSATLDTWILAAWHTVDAIDFTPWVCRVGTTCTPYPALKGEVKFALS